MAWILLLGLGIVIELVVGVGVGTGAGNWKLSFLHRKVVVQGSEKVSVEWDGKNVKTSGREIVKGVELVEVELPTSESQGNGRVKFSLTPS